MKKSTATILASIIAVSSCTWKSIPLCEAVDIGGYLSSPTGSFTGENRLWHKLTLGFNGPLTSEAAIPNPFTDYRLDVDFTHSSTGQKLTVAGYYAADGNAANTGADSGSVWLVHFRPSLVGLWNWTASFTQGANVSQYGGGQPAGYMHGQMGSLNVENTNKSGGDFRAHGRLQHVFNSQTNGNFLQFSGSGKYFLKAGADAPENLLAYQDFDNTPNVGNRRKNWAPHVKDFRNGTDPTWMGGKGAGLIGAINYLASMGMNVFSFLTFTLQGDDKNVFPFVSETEFLRIDVSKTAQWEVVFDHAESMGLFMHMKQQENENGLLLDLGELGPERRLYYRELVARFGHHLALNWNIGEEFTNTAARAQAFSEYMKEVDPYNMPIVMHTFRNEQAVRYTPMLGYPYYDGVSLQTTTNRVHSDTLNWLRQSKAAGRPWIVSNDEQNPASTGVLPDDIDPNHTVIRKYVYWGNLMAGGHGCEFYFGYKYHDSDLTCQNYATRQNMWIQAKVALDFFYNHQIPFWRMYNADSLVTGTLNWCLTDGQDYYVVYLLGGGNANLSVTGGGPAFNVTWMHAMTGQEFQGSFASITPGGITYLGFPNSTTLPLSDDWVVLMDRTSSGPPAPVASSPVAPSPVPTSPVAPTPPAPTPSAPAPVAPPPADAPTSVAPLPFTPPAVVPMPVVPAPVAPSPIASAPPNAPSPSAPPPVALAPVDATSPFIPSTPVADTPVAPVPPSPFPVSPLAPPADLPVAPFPVAPLAVPSPAVVPSPTVVPSPVVPSPVVSVPVAFSPDDAPSQIAPTPVAPLPVPSSVAPSPLAPSPAAPTPFVPASVAPPPAVPTTVAPLPVAPLPLSPAAPSPVALSPLAPPAVVPTPVVPAPVVPTPVAPAPVFPTPVAPSPVASGPVAPVPVASSVAAPSPVVPSTPVAPPADVPTPVGPAPVAPLSPPVLPYRYGISALSLINCTLGTTIGPLSDYSLSALGNLSLSVLASTYGNGTVSVCFDFDGKPKVRIESAAPYVLGGDKNGVVFNAYPPLSKKGNHTIVVTPYDGRNCSGNSGQSYRKSFRVSA